MSAARPVTVMLAALGGEGGGVLTNWLVNAAEASDLPVQATSIPGVAQRTGATTYYVEIWPEPWSVLGGQRPILALAAAVGEVDLMVASELLETARAVQNGFVTPDRTHLVASTHRTYTTNEKLAMGDGRLDGAEMIRAAEKRAAKATLADFDAIARQVDAPMNAVLLGAIAATGQLPIEAEAFRAGIRAEGKAAEANLRGFEAGLAATKPVEPADAVAASAGPRDDLAARARAEFPAAVQDVLVHALARLADYQDNGHAAAYLDLLRPFADADPALLASVARHLAVRMSYEDMIRVAQLKARTTRLARIREETGARPDEPVEVTEFFKPGLAELCDVLPVRLADRLLARAERRGAMDWSYGAIHLRTTTLWGFARLRLLAGMRRFRRSSWRFRHEAEATGQWLADVAAAAQLSPLVAVEVAECARLIKGYGDTHRRGAGNFAAIMDSLVRPAIKAGNAAGVADRVAEARGAALADPDGEALAAVLGPLPVAAE